MKAFAKVNAWGPFSASAARTALLRALREENAWRVRHKQPKLPHIRPYDLRHSALTLFASLSTDERALQDLALHSTAAQTRRYTRGSDDLRLKRAVDTIAAGLKPR